MKYFAIIFIIGFLWITRDIIRVPETFNDSFFKQFAGNQYIDPQVSWTNQYILGDLLSIVVSLGSDLFHLLGTLCIFLSVLMLWMAKKETDAYKAKHKSFDEKRIKKQWILFTIFIIEMFLFFGLGNYLAQGLWRQILN